MYQTEIARASSQLGLKQQSQVQTHRRDISGKVTKDVNKVTKQPSKALTITNKLPRPMKLVPTIGAIHGTFFCAVHPYQKNPIGVIGAKQTISGNRSSGVTSPLCFAALAFKILSLKTPKRIRPVIMPIPCPRYANPETPTEK